MLRTVHPWLERSSLFELAYQSEQGVLVRSHSKFRVRVAGVHPGWQRKRFSALGGPSRGSNREAPWVCQQHQSLWVLSCAQGTRDIANQGGMGSGGRTKDDRASGRLVADACRTGEYSMNESAGL